MSMGLRAGGCVVCATVLALAGAVEAGPLSDVVSGMKERSGQDDDDDDHDRVKGDSGDDKSDSDRDDSDHDDDDFDDDDDWGDGGDSSGSSGSGGFAISFGSPYPSYAGPTDLALYLGLQRVDDSDGAIMGSARVAYQDFGIGLSENGYYEEVRSASEVDTLELHVWTVTGQWRPIRPLEGRETQVWLSGGLAGASSDGLSLVGVVLGGSVEHHLAGAIGVEGSARAFLYQDDIQGVEVRAGVAASLVRFSYRVMKFNIGPALEGPEVGLALAF